VLICGEGGAGKTSLACEICKWAMNDETRLAQHPMIAVLLEEENLEAHEDDDVLIEAARGELWFLLDSAAPPSVELVGKLLKSKRVLIVVDGFSEMSEENRRKLQPNHPKFAAWFSEIEKICSVMQSTLMIWASFRVWRVKERSLSFLQSYTRSK